MFSNWNNNRKRIKTLENLCIEQIHVNIKNMTLSKPKFGQNVQWLKCLNQMKEKSKMKNPPLWKVSRFFYIILSTYWLCCHCQQSICTSFSLQNIKKKTIYQAKMKYVIFQVYIWQSVVCLQIVRFKFIWNRKASEPTQYK